MEPLLGLRFAGQIWKKQNTFDLNVRRFGCKYWQRPDCVWTCHGTASADRQQVLAAARSALEALARSVVDSGLCGEKFEGVEWGQLLDVRTVDYNGDEIRIAKSFAWENIELAAKTVVLRRQPHHWKQFV